MMDQPQGRLRIDAFCTAVFRLPESRHGLVLVTGITAALMGLLFIVRWKADLNFDGEVYLSAARKFSDGNFREGLAIYALPLYPYLISLLHTFIPDWVIAGKLLSFVLMTLTVIPLYKVSEDLFDQRAAFWAGIAYCLLPETLLQSNSVVRDPGSFLCFAWAVYFAQKSLQSKHCGHVTAAALWAAGAALFRMEGLILFPVYFGVVSALTLSTPGQRRDYGRMLVVWAAFFCGLAVLALAVAGERGGVFGRYNEFVAFSGGFFNLENYQRVASQLQQMQDAARHSIIGHHFAGIARKLMGFIYLAGVLYLWIKLLLPLNAILLIIGVMRTRYTARHVFVAALVICGLAGLYLFFIWHDLLLTRYLYLPALLACPWIGSGMARLLDFAAGRSFGKLMTACIVIAFFVTPALEFDKYFTKKDDLKSRAGSWIGKQESLQSLKIIFSDPVVAFYTGREIDFQGGGDTVLYLNPDDTKFSKAEQVALEKNADMIVIYARRESRNDLHPFTRYKEVKEFNDKNRVVKIYCSLKCLPLLNPRQSS